MENQQCSNSDLNDQDNVANNSQSNSQSKKQRKDILYQKNDVACHRIQQEIKNVIEDTVVQFRNSLQAELQSHSKSSSKEKSDNILKTSEEKSQRVPKPKKKATERNYGNEKAKDQEILRDSDCNSLMVEKYAKSLEQSQQAIVQLTATITQLVNSQQKSSVEQFPTKEISKPSASKSFLFKNASVPSDSNVLATSIPVDSVFEEIVKLRHLVAEALSERKKDEVRSRSEACEKSVQRELELLKAELNSLNREKSQSGKQETEEVNEKRDEVRRLREELSNMKARFGFDSALKEIRQKIEGEKIVLEGDLRNSEDVIASLKSEIQNLRFECEKLKIENSSLARAKESKSKLEAVVDEQRTQIESLRSVLDHRITEANQSGELSCLYTKEKSKLAQKELELRRLRKEMAALVEKNLEFETVTGPKLVIETEEKVGLEIELKSMQTRFLNVQKQFEIVNSQREEILRKNVMLKNECRRCREQWNELSQENLKLRKCSCEVNLENRKLHSELDECKSKLSDAVDSLETAYKHIELQSSQTVNYSQSSDGMVVQYLNDACQKLTLLEKELKGQFTSDSPVLSPLMLAKRRVAASTPKKITTSASDISSSNAEESPKPYSRRVVNFSFSDTVAPRDVSGKIRATTNLNAQSISRFRESGPVPVLKERLSGSDLSSSEFELRRSFRLNYPIGTTQMPSGYSNLTGSMPKTVLQSVQKTSSLNRGSAAESSSQMNRHDLPSVSPSSKQSATESSLQMNRHDLASARPSSKLSSTESSSHINRHDLPSVRPSPKQKDCVDAWHCNPVLPQKNQKFRGIISDASSGSELDFFTPMKDVPQKPFRSYSTSSKTTRKLTFTENANSILAARNHSPEIQSPLESFGDESSYRHGRNLEIEASEKLNPGRCQPSSNIQYDRNLNRSSEVITSNVSSVSSSEKQVASGHRFKTPASRGDCTEVEHPSEKHGVQANPVEVDCGTVQPSSKSRCEEDRPIFRSESIISSGREGRFCSKTLFTIPKDHVYGDSLDFSFSNAVMRLSGSSSKDVAGADRSAEKRVSESERDQQSVSENLQLRFADYKSTEDKYNRQDELKKISCSDEDSAASKVKVTGPETVEKMFFAVLTPTEKPDLGCARQNSDLLTKEDHTTSHLNTQSRLSPQKAVEHDPELGEKAKLELYLNSFRSVFENQRLAKPVHLIENDEAGAAQKLLPPQPVQNRMSKGVPGDNPVSEELQLESEHRASPASPETPQELRSKRNGIQRATEESRSEGENLQPPDMKVGENRVAKYRMYAMSDDDVTDSVTIDQPPQLKALSEALEATLFESRPVEKVLESNPDLIMKSLVKKLSSGSGKLIMKDIPANLHSALEAADPSDESLFSDEFPEIGSEIRAALKGFSASGTRNIAETSGNPVASSSSTSSISEARNILSSLPNNPRSQTNIKSPSNPAGKNVKLQETSPIARTEVGPVAGIEKSLQAKIEAVNQSPAGNNPVPEVKLEDSSAPESFALSHGRRSSDEDSFWN